MSLVSVFGESFAALAFTWLIGAYKFRDTWESLCKRRDLIAQVDQQIPWRDIVIVAADGYGRLPIAGCACSHIMRHETAVAKCPQQVIDALGVCAIGRMNVYGVFEPICLLGEPAGKGLARLRAGLFEKIKVDASH